MPVFTPPLTGKSNNTDLQIEVTPALLNKHAIIDDYNSLTAFIESMLPEGEKLNPLLIRRLCASYVGEVFLQGSQIHQNATILLRQGLPIIKLDGLYRGMFNLTDLWNLTEQLEPPERVELRRLLMDRPYGGDTLIGWKRAAFMRGYL